MRQDFFGQDPHLREGLSGKLRALAVQERHPLRCVPAQRVRRQGVAKMKCHKVGRSSLTPMRKIAPVDTKIGLGIEVVEHAITNKHIVTFASEIGARSHVGWGVGDTYLNVTSGR